MDISTNISATLIATNPSTAIQLQMLGFSAPDFLSTRPSPWESRHTEASRRQNTLEFSTNEFVLSHQPIHLGDVTIDTALVHGADSSAEAVNMSTLTIRIQMKGKVSA